MQAASPVKGKLDGFGKSAEFDRGFEHPDRDTQNHDWRRLALLRRVPQPWRAVGAHGRPSGRLTSATLCGRGQIVNVQGVSLKAF